MTTKKQEAKKPLMIDFRNIEAVDLAGHKLSFDVSKSLGNFIYQVTPDLGMFEVAQKIYKEGKVEVEDHVKAGLMAILKIPQCPFAAIVKAKIIELLSKPN